jgi:hexosaminidase
VFKTEIKGLQVYYTFNYTFPDNFAEEYQDKPLTMPKGATDIWAITYRNGKPVGRLLTINLEELRGRK